MRYSFFPAVVFLWSTGALAEQPPTAPQNPEEYYIDFSPPDLSAFTVLGINSNQVSRPGTVKELSAAVLNSATLEGNVIPGLAIEWSPATSFAPKTLAEYRDTSLWRGLSISVGTVATEGATRGAIGVRWLLFDGADPLRSEDLEEEILTKLAALDQLPDSAEARSIFYPGLRNTLVSLSLSADDTVELMNEYFSFPDDPAQVPDAVVASSLLTVLTRDVKARNGGTELTTEQKNALLQRILEYASIISAIRDKSHEILRQTEQAVKAAKDDFKKSHWNADTFEIGLGLTGRSSDSTWAKLAKESVAAYLGAGVGFGSSAQALLHVRYTDGITDNMDDRDWNLTLGARMLAGGSDFRATAEGVVTLFQVNDSDDLDADYRIGAGGEVKMAAGLWLEFLVGAQGVVQGDEDASVVTHANLKYAIGATDS